MAPALRAQLPATPEPTEALGLPNTPAFNEADTTDKADESLITGPLDRRLISALSDHARRTA